MFVLQNFALFSLTRHSEFTVFWNLCFLERCSTISLHRVMVCKQYWKLNPGNAKFNSMVPDYYGLHWAWPRTSLESPSNILFLTTKITVLGIIGHIYCKSWPSESTSSPENVNYLGICPKKCAPNCVSHEYIHFCLSKTASENGQFDEDGKQCMFDQCAFYANSQKLEIRGRERSNCSCVLKQLRATMKPEQVCRL